MRVITKIYKARVQGKPSVVVNLLDFKQKPLLEGDKKVENDWTIKLGDYFNILVDSKTIVLPKDRELKPEIIVLPTSKENLDKIFKDIQLALKLAKRIK